MYANDANMYLLCLYNIRMHPLCNGVAEGKTIIHIIGIITYEIYFRGKTRNVAGLSKR